MATRHVATVIGGSGFLGRHVVQRLAEDGYVVRVVGRRADRAAALRPLGDVGQIVPLGASILDEAALVPVMEGASLVVNLVGILSPQGQGGRGQGRRQADFSAIHVEAAGRVARLAASAGVARMVHVSAIGASARSPSAYGRSKAAGEDAVLRDQPRATIVRPSLIFGAGDHFLTLFAAMARYSPVVPVYGAATRVQPVHVADVAEAIRRILASDGHQGEIYELAGPRVWTMEALIRWVVAFIGRRRLIFAVPRALAYWQALLLENLPGHLLTRDQLAMLSIDNVAQDGMRGLGTLGIDPVPVEMIAPTYLARYKIT